MAYSKKSKYKVIKEGPSPEENDILVSLQDLVNQWDACEESMPVACGYKNQIKSLIKDYRSRPLSEAPVKGSARNIYDHEKQMHIQSTDQLPENVFYQLVKHIVNKEEKSFLEDSHRDDGTYDGLHHLTKITKLYGVPNTYWQTTEATGIMPRVILAAIENYEGVKDGTINNFEGLSLAPLKTYKVDLHENWVEHVSYAWTVIIEGYSEYDVMHEITMNEDGYYDWYEWDNQPGFEKDYGDSDRDGIEIDNIEIVPEKDPKLNESSLVNTQVYKHLQKPIDKSMVAFMKHLSKEYSKEEIKNMIILTPDELEVDLQHISKLYSFGNMDHLLIKQILQFMWDKNLPEDYSTFIGDQLPPINEYTAVMTFIEWDKISKDAYIKLYDTNWESVKLEITDNFWDHQPEYENYDVLDSDFMSDSEEFAEIRINGKSVWSLEDKGAGSKFQIY